MSSTCKLVGNDTVGGCESSMSECLAEMTGCETSLSASAGAWNQYDAANANWSAAQGQAKSNWTSATKTSNPIIWDNNSNPQNCVSEGEYTTGPFETNCNSADDAHARCSACGYNACTCTAGLNQVCGQSCSNFQTNSQYAYVPYLQKTYSWLANQSNSKIDQPTFLSLWLAQNPQPKQPSIPDIRGTSCAGCSTVCSSCEQCMNFSVAATQANFSQLQQSCINQISQTAPTTPTTPPPTTPTTPPPTTSSHLLLYAGIGAAVFVILLIVIALIVATGSSQPPMMLPMMPPFGPPFGQPGPPSIKIY